MELNSALMESITSMSEFFVAANTRTSFTDLAHPSATLNHSPHLPTPSSTASLSSSSSGSTSSSFASSSPSTSSISAANLHSITAHSGPNMNHHQPHHFNQAPPSTLSAAGQPNSQKNVGNSNQIGSLVQQQQHPSMNNNNNINANNNGNNPHSSCNNTNNNNNSSANNGENNFSNNHHNNNYINSNINSNANVTALQRPSQPIRTQIPIHCYIEQLDACADIPKYMPTLNDNDLFNTVDSKSASQTQTHCMHPHQPHLNQSKLALESVTNCSSNTTSLGNSSSLFNGSTPTNNTSNLATVTANTSQHSSNNSGSKFASSSLDNHHFQSCRETYAIVTSNVLYIDLVRTVLLQLGYSAMDLINAKGE